MLGMNMMCLCMAQHSDGMAIEGISKRRSAVREHRLEKLGFRRQAYVFEHRSAWLSPKIGPYASEPDGDGKVFSAQCPAFRLLVDTPCRCQRHLRRAEWWFLSYSILVLPARSETFSW